jgi:FtsP/CotA-like multicopper oxidase with cupredoxin domain
MVSRRDVLKIGIGAGGGGLLGGYAYAQDAVHREWTRFLCPPDDRPRELPDQRPSPPARPFAQPVFSPGLMRPVPALDPPPDPRAHQRYEEFAPKRFYEIHEREFRWTFHPDPPYDRGTWVWGFQSGDLPPSSPGPSYAARYGEPVLVRRFNDLPTVGHAQVRFALPSTTTHLHNGHTASESDGNPQDWIDPGEFWDHHYGNFPSGFDPREKLTTLWYHDHRLDFTAANVYSGLYGFYLLFDEDDTGNETTGWRLPSFPDYDVPLVLQDMKFAVGESGGAEMVFDNWNTDGMIGDVFTVNRKITPYLPVEPRKYRIRILNGGPSRFYQLFLRDPQRRRGTEHPSFLAITGDGNFLPEPVETQSVYLSVAQRVDVIMDFSGYRPGDHVFLHNLLDQRSGAGPATRPIDPAAVSRNPLDFGDPETFLLRFDVVPPKGKDESRIPDYFRPLPEVNLAEAKQTRLWRFDYDGGLWTINERIMDPNRIDAGIEQGSAEVWIFRNDGNDWAHPVHSHFTEFLILEVNGRPFLGSEVQTVEGEEVDIVQYLGLPPERRMPLKVYLGGPRRDVATLLPGDEIKVFMRWKDFLGKHVMHCHNVVHEDHAMMIRWDIVEPGTGFTGPRTSADVYGEEPPPYEPPFPDPRPPSPAHQEEHPGNPVQSEG